MRCAIQVGDSLELLSEIEQIRDWLQLHSIRMKKSGPTPKQAFKTSCRPKLAAIEAIERKLLRTARVAPGKEGD
jgi:hypothetical protein